MGNEPRRAKQCCSTLIWGWVKAYFYHMYPYVEGYSHPLTSDFFVPTGWWPPVSWFINPINCTYIYHKPQNSATSFRQRFTNHRLGGPILVPERSLGLLEAPEPPGVDRAFVALQQLHCDVVPYLGASLKTKH